MYPATKVACEHMLRAYATTYGFELVMLRFGAAYGFGHYAGGPESASRYTTSSRRCSTAGRARSAQVSRKPTSWFT